MTLYLQGLDASFILSLILVILFRYIFTKFQVDLQTIFDSFRKWVSFFFFALIEKSKFCVLVKHYFLNGKTIKRLMKILEINIWSLMRHIEFYCGTTSTNNAEHPGCLNEVTTDEMVNKINDIVFNVSVE